MAASSLSSAVRETKANAEIASIAAIVRARAVPPPSVFIGCAFFHEYVPLYEVKERPFFNAVPL
jgi:hypothetical protein